MFKGGTCLKKCYFETYRFSEDLDFTLRDEAGIEEGFLRRVIGEVVEWVSDESGLTIPSDQLTFDIYENPRGRRSCQGKVGYRGPVSPSSIAGGWPKIKLDLTADETLVLPAVRRPVFHPYSDGPADGMWINSYAYEEAFGEKIRALAERTRPRDLYDVINLYRHGDTRPSASLLHDVLTQKCAYKRIALPSMKSLELHREDMESMWVSMLAHQLPVLPSVVDFWAALPEVLDWLMGGLEAPQAPAITVGSEETTIRSRVLPSGIPMRTRGSLQIIRFAAANHLCVDLTYDGRLRRIEPYSLRKTAEGNFILHATRADSGAPRSYRIDKIAGASVTDQTFNPRYLVELTTSGPFSLEQTDFALDRPAAHSRSAGSLSNRPVYVFRCPYCNKSFDRRLMDGSLNAHKDRIGYRCPGRSGIYMRTKS